MNCLATFKSGTPQYMHNMNLDKLAKARVFNVNTFFLTVSWTELNHPEITQVVARQYGTMLMGEGLIILTRVYRFMGRGRCTTIKLKLYR